MLCPPMWRSDRQGRRSTRPGRSLRAVHLPTIGNAECLRAIHTTDERASIHEIRGHDPRRARREKGSETCAASAPRRWIRDRVRPAARHSTSSEGRSNSAGRSVPVPRILSESSATSARRYPRSSQARPPSSASPGETTTADSLTRRLWLDHLVSEGHLERLLVAGREGVREDDHV